MARLFGVVALHLIVVWTSSAQTTNGGSTYSIFNIGDLQTGNSPASAGRAGVESAVPTPEIINTVNPAAWGDLRYTTIQASLTFNQYRASDAMSSVDQNDTRIGGFAFGFRWSEALGGGAALTISPYSIVNYRTSESRPVPGSDSTDTARIVYTGRGGISKARLGGCFRPVSRISLGAAASFYFGSIESISDVSFTTGSALNPATYTSASRYSGLGVEVGMWAEPADDIRVACVAVLGTTLTRSRIETSSFVQGGTTIRNSDTTGDDDIALPARITAGVSWKSGRFLLSADASTQSWSNQDFPTARGATRVAFGVDRLPSASLNASGFERWTFRVGGYVDQTYYTLPTGTVGAVGATLGARWPITTATNLTSSTVLDVALEGGSRGSTDEGMTREVFARVSVGLSINELWFLKRR